MIAFRRRRRFPARFFIFLLTLGILAMLLINIGHNATHNLRLMEPVSPLTDALDKPQLQLSEIHDNHTIKVAVNGKIVQMALEDYVYGVVSAEMPASFAPEALKAQAVAARTFAVRRLMYGGDSKYPGADVCDDSGHCQAYRTDTELKSRWKDSYDSFALKILQAVQDTAGKIITYQGQPILVLYHAASAGYTEDVENVYSQNLPYLRSVPSPGDGTVTDLESQETFARSEFAAKVNRQYSDAGLTAGNLDKQVSIQQRYPSGRVEEVKLGGADASGVDIRGLLGLRSANFTVSFTKSSVVVTTEGFGHGVGMSQDGAQAMALSGSNYLDILKHYYTGVEIGDMN